MYESILKEITPLTSNDCFTIFSRKKAEFDFPYHYHEEIELNYIRNAKGAQRIVGDHIEEIGNQELVLVGSNLPHVWQTHHCKTKNIQEITIQFHKDLFDEKFLRRNQMHFIRAMLEKSKRGILFSKETTIRVSNRMEALYKKQGFDSVLELMSIMHDLSSSRNMRILSDGTFTDAKFSYNSRRIEIVMDYMNENFDKHFGLAEAARLTNMTEVSFSRFFKQRTGISFIDSLIEIRLGHASRLLIDTTQSIAEIAYNCGFNNLSNFNRAFKNKKNCTPKEFRENMAGKRTFV
ncbi:MAG: AraC family transcriptional regulator [Ginsengibacter sp.]